MNGHRRGPKSLLWLCMDGIEGEGEVGQKPQKGKVESEVCMYVQVMWNVSGYKAWQKEMFI